MKFIRVINVMWFKVKRSLFVLKHIAYNIHLWLDVIVLAIILICIIYKDMFSLHPQLAQDTFFVGDFPLSTCRLMNDMQFPWLILIPRVPGITELYELSQADQEQFLRESSWIWFRSSIFTMLYVIKTTSHGQNQFGVLPLFLIAMKCLRICVKL